MTVTTFSGLEPDESLLETLQDEGFIRLTAIQAAAIPLALDGRDILDFASTGTGRAVAYLLPALQHLLDFPYRRSGPPRISILAPTCELVMQVANHAHELAEHMHLGIATITGGVVCTNYVEVLSGDQGIVVATTGRLLQCIKEEDLDCHAVETLILGEADRTLDVSFTQDIEYIAGRARWHKQTLLFSTMLEGDAIQDFAEHLLEDPVEVSANPSTRKRKKIHQWYYRADDLEHRAVLLMHLLKQPEATRSVVFVHRRERVYELADWLREAGINSCYLEGEMVQDKRSETVRRLTRGHTNTLVTTNVTAHDIDIPDVGHVFNFNIPHNGDTYLCHIECTVRAGREGIAISLVEAHDHLLPGKVDRYIEGSTKVRVIDKLYLKTRASSEKQTSKPSKKVLAKHVEKKKTKEKEKPRAERRHRDIKSTGRCREPSGTGVPPQATEE